MDKIEKSIDKNIYRHNGFRLLNLPISTSNKNIRRRFGKIESFKKVSGNEDEVLENFKDDLLFPIIPSPSYKDYQDANNRLNKIKIRFIDEIFWFWPSDLESLDKNIESLEGSEDYEAFEYLENGEYDKFIEYWQDLNDNNVKYHNLAIFYQIISLDLYYANKNPRKRRNYSEKALKYWYCALNDSNFKGLVKYRVEKLDDPMLKESDVDNLFEELPKSLLSIYLELTKEFIDLNDFEEVQALIHIINDSHFEKDIIDSINENLMSYIKNKLDKSEENLKSTNERNIDGYFQYILNVKSNLFEVYPLLNIVVSLELDMLKIKRFIEPYIFTVRSSLAIIMNKIVDDEDFYMDNIEKAYLYFSLIHVFFIYFKKFKIFSNLSEDIGNLENYIGQLKGRLNSQTDKFFIDFVIDSMDNELNKGIVFDDFDKLKQYQGVSNNILKECEQILTF